MQNRRLEFHINEIKFSDYFLLYTSIFSEDWSVISLYIIQGHSETSSQIEDLFPKITRPEMQNSLKMADSLTFFIIELPLGGFDEHSHSLYKISMASKDT